jgi:hypothetical protein
MHVYTAGSGKGYNMHVHTAGDGKAYTCTSTLLAVKRDTSCTSIPMAVEGDTHCMSILLAVERIQSAHPYCWQWKGIQPARPYFWQWKGYHLHIHTADSGRRCVHTAGARNGHTLHVHRRLLVVLLLLFLKIICKCRNVRQKLVRIGISSSSQLPQSGIPSGSVRYRWSTD